MLIWSSPVAASETGNGCPAIIKKLAKCPMGRPRVFLDTRVMGIFYRKFRQLYVFFMLN